MVKDQYYLSCGCVLLKKQLILHNSVLSCPEHLEGVTHVKRPCSRCGLILENKTWNFTTVFCDDCYKILSQAKTICNYHDLDSFVDPILLRKDLKTIAEDICLNVFFKNEVIQIDKPREVQHEQKPIIIDIEQKLKILKEKVSWQHSQASH